MKISLTFKTPDCMDLLSYYDASNYMEENPSFETEEEALEDMKDFLSKWVKHGELVTIEFDTVAQTAVVKTK